MTRTTNNLVIALLAAVAALMLPALGAAQNVIVDETFIQLWSAAGATAYLGQSGDLFLGGAGSAGNITLRDTDGTNRVFFDGGTSDLYFGGGGDAGDIFIRDTDGITTTIALRGGDGLVELGSVDDDGDLQLWDGVTEEVSIDLDGGSGNVTNGIFGNGLVRAWAKIHSGGSAQSCFRCDSTVTQTQKTATGQYVVDFTPAAGGPGLPIFCQLGDIDDTQPLYIRCEWLITGQVRVFVFVDDGGEADLRDFPFEVFVF